MKNPLIVILGPTASGKTKLAIALAEFFDGEIISADSRQIFKGMDIGTGKDLEAYKLGDKIIPHHLIDILEPGERYHADAFLNGFYAAFELIIKNNHLPLVCGGTGMYLQALLQGHQLTGVPVNQFLRDEISNMDKAELIKRLHQYRLSLRKSADESTVKRLIRAIEIAEFLTHHPIPVKQKILINPIAIGLRSSAESRREKILNRLNRRLEQGLVQEGQRLMTAGLSKEMLIFYGLEYKFVIRYLDGQFSYETFKERLGIAICQYAKRQMTFFRKMERDGISINWLESDQDEGLNLAKAKKLVCRFLKG